MNPGDRQRECMWHPFSSPGRVAGRELVLERGEGVWLWDAAGRRFLDASASLWYSNIGHGRREIAEAVNRQLLTLETYSTFGDLATEPALQLAYELSTRAPMENARVFFGSGGGDAIETAAKLARRYWGLVGAPSRQQIISRKASYHGTHGYGTALGGIPANAEGMGELVPAVSRVAHSSPGALEDEIDRLGADRVAAFLFEPVIGAGGVHPPSEDYVSAVGEICRKAGVLIIVDSIICGFGRLGTWFGIERWDLEPDMICFAKGVTSGYLPLGGVLVGERVASPFWVGDAEPFRHGATYSGHAACCAAGLANLRILEEDDLLHRGRSLEAELAASLERSAEHQLVSEVRAGTGLMGAVELSPDTLKNRPTAVADLVAIVRNRGVLVRPLGTSVAVSPPLVVTSEQIEQIGTAIADGLEALASELDKEGRPPRPRVERSEASVQRYG